jgi:hypothetical protein
MKREHRYDPAGGCIYCPNPADSMEHIIPRSLGGMLWSPDASCPDCRGITHAFEGQCADKMFAPLRRQYPFPRSKHKGPRRPLRASVDGIEKIFADEDFPGIITGFQFDPPGILGLGPPAKETFTGGVAVKILPEFGARLNRLRASEIRFDSSGLTTIMFGRMLAKIAHSYAVAEEGRDAFKPLLLDIIKDPSTKFIGHLVGRGFGPISAGDDLHEILIDPFFKQYVVVQIRLFADRDLPTYWVVAGERR